MNERSHIFILAATVLALLGFTFGVLRPRASEASDLRTELRTAVEEEASLNARLAMLRDIDARRDEIEAAVAESNSLLPKSPQLIRFVRLLHRASVQSGVDLKEIAPSPPQDSQVLVGGKVVTAALVVEGGYDRIENFTTRLEELPRAVQVTSMSYSPTTVGNRTIIVATMTIEFFMFDPGAAGAGTSATTDPAGAEGVTQ